VDLAERAAGIPGRPGRGEGCTIEDIDGNLFLDFNAGIAVTSTGHCHPDVVAAIQDQAGKLIHYSADFYVPLYAEMCAELARIAPMKEKCRVFLGNSGTEAVEGAIKLARFATKPPVHRRVPGRVPRPDLRLRVADRVEGQVPRRLRADAAGRLHAPFGHVADLKWFDDVLFDRLVPPEEVAAIILEPIQGEGGYIVPEDGFIQGLRKICDEHGIVLIADEVQAGAGRTGKMWSIQNWDVEPDIVATAKGIASGMPLGAFIARDSLMKTCGARAPTARRTAATRSPAPPRSRRSSCSKRLMANATARGNELLAGLRSSRQSSRTLIRDVRGIGLMIGVEFDTHEHSAAVEMGRVPARSARRSSAATR
jgi:4-aminobutyrate aminotransferase